MKEDEQCIGAHKLPKGQAHSIEAEQLGTVHYHGHVANTNRPVDIQPPEKCGTIIEPSPVECLQAAQGQSPKLSAIDK